MKKSKIKKAVKKKTRRSDYDSPWKDIIDHQKPLQAWLQQKRYHQSLPIH
ncbi:MAG: hypothetical protein GY795_28935 [Desulfobacterales bacterium]|nr:hypothetical protein [Desulfobacterales bacterium]